MAETTASHRHANGAHTNSSPRSVLTPVAPNRLTLPPSHQQPSFTPRAQNSDDGSGMSEYPPANRPGSSRFIEYGLFQLSSLALHLFLRLTLCVAAYIGNTPTRLRLGLITRKHTLPRFRMPKPLPYAMPPPDIKCKNSLKDKRIQP